MSQGLVSVVLESETEGSRIHDYVNDLSTAHIVVLDDGETYGAAEASMVWLDGKGYLITELLDFYLALNEKPLNRDNEDRPVCPLPSSEGFPEDGPTVETCPNCGEEDHWDGQCWGRNNG